MRSFSVFSASVRRTLALVLGCVLVMSWVGSANAVCAMAVGSAMGTSTGTLAGTSTGGPMSHDMSHDMVMPGASAGPMPALARHASAPRDRGHAPPDDGCPMHGRGDSPCTAPAAEQTRHDGLHGLTGVHAASRAPVSGTSSGTMPVDCAVAAHCAALTAAAVTPVVATDAPTLRVTRVSAEGPLLGASEAAVEPTAPPPRG